MEKFLKLGFVSVLTVLAGCAGSGSGGSAAEAALKPTQGSKATGSVSFRQQAYGVLVTANLTGLTPGPHGFHIHEKGDCSAPDGTSAGGHFNPTGKPHGHPDHAERHVGDLPQLVADASGNASLTIEMKGMTVGEGPANIIGRGLIVHAAADDYKTQPTGNSGARVACGVIESR